MSPLTASFTVPSPPTATTTVAPSAAARSASAAMWPGRVREQRLADEPVLGGSVSDLRPDAARPAVVRGGIDEKRDVPVLGHDASVLRVSHGAERELGHAVDRLGEGVVADALPVVAGEQVGDDEQRAGVDAAQRGDGEQGGGLHLDRQNAALGPAASLFGVGIVERVGR